ncbi:hypothetical protein IWQ62_000457 [Dispira parvispora]|uniref:GAR domain-containing protein n=1 Tax=Dispira parvispora TaxID=1520584 RepID=A0A9W8B0M4_9FUNG|nr:hypothetical protein IWQ62_000457 [Dispira parvispora]
MTSSTAYSSDGSSISGETTPGPQRALGQSTSTSVADISALSPAEKLPSMAHTLPGGYDASPPLPATLHSTRLPQDLSLPQMLDNFNCGAQKVKLWLEAAKVYLDSMDVHQANQCQRECQEFEAMVKDFTPTVELLCNLGDSIRLRITKIQGSLPDDEQQLRNDQAYQAQTCLKHILTDWRTVNQRFGAIQRQWLELQYKDQLLGAIQQLQTDLRQSVGSVQTFARQWASTHSPAEDNPSGSPQHPVVNQAGEINYSHNNSPKVQKQEDHALARLHHQVASFEPRLKQLKSQVTKFVQLHSKHSLPLDCPYPNFQTFYDAVHQEWQDLRQHLAQLKRRVVSERWVSIFEHLSSEIRADMGELGHLVQSTRGDMVQIQSAAGASPNGAQEQYSNLEAVRERFYSQRTRPMETVTKLFRHLASRYDREVLKQRVPDLVKQYDGMQQTWYEVQEALCHLEDELSHLYTTLGYPSPIMGPDPADSHSLAESRRSSMTDHSVTSLSLVLQQYRLDQPAQGALSDSTAVTGSPPSSPQDTLINMVSTDGEPSPATGISDKRGAQSPRFPPVPPPRPLALHGHSNRGAASPATSNISVPVRSFLPRPKTPGATMQFSRPMLLPPGGRKSLDAGMSLLNPRPTSSMEMRRSKTPSFLPRPKTPVRSAATSPTPGSTHLSTSYLNQPLPAMPIYRTSPSTHPMSLGKSNVRGNRSPQIKPAMAFRSGGNAHANKARPKTPGNSLSSYATSEADVTFVNENGLTNMDLLLQLSKSTEPRPTNLRFGRLTHHPVNNTPVAAPSRTGMRARTPHGGSPSTTMASGGTPQLHHHYHHSSLAQTLAQSTPTRTSRTSTSNRVTRGGALGQESQRSLGNAATPTPGGHRKPSSGAPLRPRRLSGANVPPPRAKTPGIRVSLQEFTPPNTQTSDGWKSALKPTSDVDVVLSDLPHYEPVDPNDPLDREISNIINRSPVPTPVYRVGAGRYYLGAHSESGFGTGKLVLCRLRHRGMGGGGSHSPISPVGASPQRSSAVSPVGNGCSVLVRVGGGWQDLDLFLLDLGLSNTAMGVLPAYSSATTN